MKRKVKGFLFRKICDIVPELDADGTPIEHMPQSRYNNSDDISLHNYGNGPFCRFRVPKKCNGSTGVYIILVDGKIYYVGKCEDIVKRFNLGYGNISPRNCYVNGQSTNCRINSLILETYKSGSQIDLLFYETTDRCKIEISLINELDPVWNIIK